MAQLKRGNERLGRDLELDPKVNPPSCKVSAKKDLDIEVFFPYFDMFPCQKGFRHATGIGDYG